MSTRAGKVAVGLLGTKNSFSGNNTAALVIAFSLWLMQPRLQVMSRPLLIVCMGCLALGLLISGSRGYLLGGLASFGLVLLWYRSPGPPTKKQFAGGLLLGIGCIAILSTAFAAVNAERMEELGKGEDANVFRRLQLFEYAISLWSKSTLVGIGPGAITQPDLVLRETYSPWFAERVGGSKPDYGDWTWVGDLPLGQHAHNQLLQLLTDYGLIGLLLIGATLFAGIRGGVFRSFPPIDWDEVGRRRLAVTSLFYVTVAGASAGYTLTSASIAWSTWVLVAGCRAEDTWYDPDAEPLDEDDRDDDFQSEELTDDEDDQ
ncbi:MAG: O-antigen ligase family protein [Planctomycetota bacterium]